jgi:hypothetical protein
VSGKKGGDGEHRANPNETQHGLRTPRRGAPRRAPRDRPACQVAAPQVGCVIHAVCMHVQAPGPGCGLGVCKAVAPHWPGSESWRAVLNPRPRHRSARGGHAHTLPPWEQEAGGAGGCRADRDSGAVPAFGRHGRSGAPPERVKGSASGRGLVAEAADTGLWQEPRGPGPEAPHRVGRGLDRVLGSRVVVRTCGWLQGQRERERRSSRAGRGQDRRKQYRI